MITNLDKYNPVMIPSESNNHISTFIIPMITARDILLADLATEMTGSNNRFYFDGSFWSSDGPDKFFDEHNEKWYARITGARREHK